jgi:glycosyltransferase involved in cell wall biosynthesis
MRPSSPNGGPIRVAHVITRLELGGAQLNTLYTCAHLPADRFRVHLLTGPGGLLDDEARANPHSRVHIIPDLVRRLDPVRDPRALLELYRTLRLIRPDLVHTHSSKAGILGRFAARLARVRAVVHTFHGFGFHDEQPAWYRRLLIGVERRAARCTDYFLAVSEETLRAGRAAGVIDPARAEVLPSGIELKRYLGTPRNRSGLLEEIDADDDSLIVGMIACLKPQKAPLDFVRMAARVLRQLPEARFVLAGDGVLRNRVAERIYREGLAGRVHLLGWRRDVAGFLAGLDVLALTSRWEGLPRVFAEARAVGVPIVATRVGGAAEAIRDGDSGFVVAPGDIDTMARQVVRLLRDTELRRSMAERGRAGLERWDIDAMVRRQAELYGELLNPSPLARGVRLARAG